MSGLSDGASFRGGLDGDLEDSAKAPSRDARRVHFVSLGCPKNRVDAEIMLGHLEDASFVLTPSAEGADVIVVNTCGFIEDAKKESIDVILEMAKHRTNGRAKKLIVAGCLAQRYATELAEEIPEIDVVLGTGAYESIVTAATKRARAKGRATIDLEPPRFLHQATSPRLNTFLPHSAYVKVSEGCDQKCSFCAIPSIRGRQRSRTIDDIVREAAALGGRGIVELNLIAQDLTGYGSDIEPRATLAELLRALGTLDDISWIRLHYAYPRPFSKALLRAMAEIPRILPYLDMPLQHIADPVLRRMRRGRPRAFVERLLGDIRKNVPEIVLRTSFIVGFPGETEGDFEELVDFAMQEDFERVGVFRFSREDGTPSFDLPDQIEPSVIAERYDRLMSMLLRKSHTKMSSYVGRTLEVLVDGPSEETDLLMAGRHKGQAPEIDGTTYINDGVTVRAGDIIELEVTESFDYDLVGRAVRVLRPAPPRPDHARLEARPLVRQSATTGSPPRRSGRASLRVLEG